MVRLKRKEVKKFVIISSQFKGKSGTIRRWSNQISLPGASQVAFA